MALQIISQFTSKYPVVRGMLTYAISWPCSNLCQQSIQHRKKYDFGDTIRFSLFGSLFVAPTSYLWIRFIGNVLPGQSLKIAIVKSLMEQILISPFRIAAFYIGLTLMEGKTWADAKQELQNKFLFTYGAGFCVWPLVQTLNIFFVKERNRVSVTGTVSFFHTIFLSYMKQLETESHKQK